MAVKEGTQMCGRHYKTLNHKVRAKSHQHPQMVSVIYFCENVRDAQTASRAASIMCLSVHTCYNRWSPGCNKSKFELTSGHFKTRTQAVSEQPHVRHVILQDIQTLLIFWYTCRCIIKRAWSCQQKSNKVVLNFLSKHWSTLCNLLSPLWPSNWNMLPTELKRSSDFH